MGCHQTSAAAAQHSRAGDFAEGCDYTVMRCTPCHSQQLHAVARPIPLAHFRSRYWDIHCLLSHPDTVALTSDKGEEILSGGGDQPPIAARHLSAQ